MFKRDPMIQRRGASQSATFVVAASDSLHQGLADYVCDGVDDQVKIQAAIDALSAIGGKVVVMEGSYSWKHTVTVGDNVTLEFLPGNTITIPSDHSLTVYVNEGDNVSTAITNDDHVGGNEHVNIIGANIDFNGDNGKILTQTWAGIWLNNCTKSNVKDCIAYDVVYSVNTAVARAYGILFTGDSYCNIIGCEAAHCGYEGIGIRGVNDHILVTECFGADNAVHLAQGSAWLMGTDDPSDVIFDNCYGNKDIIFHGSVGGALLNNCKIQNCIVPQVSVKGDIINCVASGNIVSEYIHVSAIGSGTLQNILVDNNLVYRDANWYGILVETTTGSIDNLIVSNNQLRKTCVEVNTNGAGDMSNVSIENNNIIVTGGSAYAGIELNIKSGGDISNVLIANNQFGTTVSNFLSADVDGDGNIKYVTLSNNNATCNRFVSTSKTSGGGLIEHLKISDNNLHVATTVCVGGSHLSSIIANDNQIISANYLFAGAIDDLYVVHNKLDTISNFDNGGLTNLIVQNNYGYITENSGTDTIASASTSKAVTHGLSVTPSAGDIMVTPMESLGNASFFWVDTYTSTQFTIHTNVAPGADTDFAWKAIVL